MLKRYYDLVDDLRGPVKLSRSSSFNHIISSIVVTHFTWYRYKNAHLHCADGLRMKKRCYNLVADLRGPVEKLICSAAHHSAICYDAILLEFVVDMYYV